MKRQSGYRAEQLRTLSLGFARRVAVGLIAWTVIFAVLLAAIDAFVAPRAADAISSACPWRSVLAEEAGLEDTVWFEGSLERTRITMISCVLCGFQRRCLCTWQALSWLSGSRFCG